jgi:WD40 repeat protein
LGDPEVVKRHEAAAVRELNQYGELSTYVPIMMTDTDGSVTGETKNTFLSHFKSEGGRARSIPQLDSLAHSIFRPTIAVDSGRLIHFERTADGLLVLQSDFQTPPTRVMFNYTGTIHPRAVTPDGRHLVLALDQGLLRVFDFRTNELTDGFQGHKAAVYQVAFTPNGQTALSLSEDGTCAIWDLHTREGGRHLKSTEPLEIKAVSADSRRALLVSPRLLVIVFPLEAGDKSAPHLLEGHTAIIHDVAVTPDGHRVVSVSEDCTLKIWSLDSGQELSSVTLDQPIHKVAFALDGEAIIMGDAVGNIYCLRYMG